MSPSYPGPAFIANIIGESQHKIPSCPCICIRSRGPCHQVSLVWSNSKAPDLASFKMFPMERAYYQRAASIIVATPTEVSRSVQFSYPRRQTFGQCQIGESQSTIPLKASPSVDAATVLSLWKLRAPKGGGYLRFVLRCNASTRPTAEVQSGGFGPRARCGEISTASRVFPLNYISCNGPGF